MVLLDPRLLANPRRLRPPAPESRCLPLPPLPPHLRHHLHREHVRHLAHPLPHPRDGRQRQAPARADLLLQPEHREERQPPVRARSAGLGDLWLRHVHDHAGVYILHQPAPGVSADAAGFEASVLSDRAIHERTGGVSRRGETAAHLWEVGEERPHHWEHCEAEEARQQA